MATNTSEVIEKARKILALEADMLALRVEIDRLKKLHDHIKTVSGVYVHLKEVSFDNEFTRKVLILGVCEIIESARKEVEHIENQILKQ